MSLMEWLLILFTIPWQKRNGHLTQQLVFFQGLHACFPNFSKVISEEENKLQEKYLSQSFILRDIKTSKCLNGKKTQQNQK